MTSLKNGFVDRRCVEPRRVAVSGPFSIDLAVTTGYFAELSTFVFHKERFDEIDVMAGGRRTPHHHRRGERGARSR
jgi:hypothetical protein